MMQLPPDVAMEIAIGRIADLHIERLLLSPHVLDLLENQGVKTVGEVARMNDAKLMQISGIGPKRAENIRSAIRSEAVDELFNRLFLAVKLTGDNL